MDYIMSIMKKMNQASDEKSNVYRLHRCTHIHMLRITSHLNLYIFITCVKYLVHKFAKCRGYDCISSPTKRAICSKLSGKLYCKNQSVIKVCTWDKVIIEYYACFQAIVKGDLMEQFTGYQPIESAKEYINLITSIDDISSYARLSSCVSNIHKTTSSEIMKSSNVCDKFKYIGHKKKRTHLYYIGQPTKPTDSDPYDVTLVTQLTLDR